MNLRRKAYLFHGDKAVVLSKRTILNAADAEYTETVLYITEEEIDELHAELTKARVQDDER